MASFSAELHVSGHVFPVTHCLFDVTQATQQRGRVSAKVRYGPVQLVLDVPDGDVLPAWAADAQKRQAASIVFLAAAGGQPLETLRLPAAYCVAYQEQFVSGDAQSGSYQCALTLSDPTGWTLAPGGPTTAFVAPAARNHGAPLAAAAAAAAAVPIVGATASALRTMAIGGSPQPTATVSPLPLPDKVAPASWAGNKTHDAAGAKLVANTLPHKVARWAEYQRDKAANPKAYSQDRWSKQYDANMQNSPRGLKREREYAAAMGGVSKILKTPFTARQIDVYKEDTAYCGQVKTGKVSLNKQAKIDLQKDKYLIDEEYTVEYILEKGASKPLLGALKKIGADVKIGPQIP
ncbi:MAG: hypothetical protein EOO55_04090 [Hymenobacter sp.]|nr:MAG: hypothetical protein EOO55_04090 [Hymenobacter sp.]